MKIQHHLSKRVELPYATIGFECQLFLKVYCADEYIAFIVKHYRICLK